MLTEFEKSLVEHRHDIREGRQHRDSYAMYYDIMMSAEVCECVSNFATRNSMTVDQVRERIAKLVAQDLLVRVRDFTFKVTDKGRQYLALIEQLNDLAGNDLLKINREPRYLTNV